MVKLLQIALKCIYKYADARPTISQVAEMIHSLKEEEDSYDRDRDNKERIHIDERAHQESKPVSRARSNSCSPSPKRGPSGWGRSRSRSRSIDRYGKSTTENRHSPIRGQPSRRSPASYDDGEIRDDQLHRSEIPSDDPAPYVDNERREASPSPISWHQKFQNPRPSNDEPVRPQRSATGGDEAEEGMIMPEEEEGMIHPDE
ncbi:uncharacterized protein A4U43_C07F34990 [Asparagus officinalis]|uniref:Uncharacterized protein n=1 Tax=Asparagus officinalis TaxID=4686 RepID=A0A5P1EH38_ASPOF|nr:uncharacterized protein A4U43_C07F34990 [Asparagus officinalis]